MDDIDGQLKRIFRPHSVVNWVRHNMRRLDDTQQRIRDFALRPPQHSLSPVYAICQDIVITGKSLEDSLRACDTIKRPLVRIAASEIIPRFHQYATRNNIEGVADLCGFEIMYPIGRGPDGKTLAIPIRPTFIAIDGDKLKPYFIIGWSKLAYDHYQKQLLSTIICKAVLSHQYFLGSDAQIVCLPRMKLSRARDLLEWRATLYGTLSDEQLLEQFERYGAAVNLVARELRGE